MIIICRSTPACPHSGALSSLPHPSFTTTTRGQTPLKDPLPPYHRSTILPVLSVFNCQLTHIDIATISSSNTPTPSRPSSQ